VNKSKGKSLLIKILLVISGFLSLGLGILGIFVPLLPTTPFLLLAAYLFFKSSNKLYSWLIKNKYLGSYIENYRKHKAISLRAKIFSLSLLWVTISFSIYYFREQWWLIALLIIIASAVSLHILKFKTLKRE